MGTKTGGLRCTEMYGGDFLLCYCKRVIYGTYLLLPLVHKQFIRGYFFETGEVSRVAKLWYWIRKTVLHVKECSKCCIVCKYYEICKNDGTLE